MKMQRALVYLLLLLTTPFAAQAEQPEPTKDDLLPALLEGEFALQGGDHAAAATAYVQAAAISTDPKIAERAVQAALLANEPTLARQALVRWQTLQPDNSGIGAAQLRLALRDDDKPAARAALERLFTQEDGWRQAAGALAAQQDKAIVAELLDEMVESNRLPDKFEAWLTLGGVALRLSDKDLYARLAAAVPQKFPQEPRAFIWLAESAREAGDKVAAQAAIKSALALPDLDNQTRLQIAAQLDALGDPAASAKALDIPDADESLIGARATYLLRAKDQDGLAKLYKEINKGSADKSLPATRLFLLGQISEMREEHETALGWYQKITAGMPWEQSRLRIALLLDKLGRSDEAIARLREIQAGDVESGELIRDAYLFEADLHQRAKRGNEELAALSRGISIFEGDSALLYARALAYERLDRVEESIADFRTLAKDQPDDPTVMNALGYTLVDRTDRIEEGFDLIEKAIAANPDEPAVQDSMGWALHKLGRNAEALPFLKKAFEGQHDAEVAAHLATVLWELDKKDEARSMLRLARELDPDNRALRAAVQRIGE
ncbi:MAG: tetratricopeptide repeat protein [Lysobacteraceae bacterium]